MPVAGFGASAECGRTHPGIDDFLRNAHHRATASSCRRSSRSLRMRPGACRRSCSCNGCPATALRSPTIRAMAGPRCCARSSATRTRSCGERRSAVSVRVKANARSMDYDTELADHREALTKLRQRADVDPRRIVIFGGSIGGTYAPLLAADEQVAGVMIWGAGATTWAERMLKFERNALELGGSPPESLAKEMTLRLQFLDQYLVEARRRRRSPPAMRRSAPYGARSSAHPPTRITAVRLPFIIRRSAPIGPVHGARCDAPVLALFGEYDWFESRRCDFADRSHREHEVRRPWHLRRDSAHEPSLRAVRRAPGTRSRKRTAR